MRLAAVLTGPFRQAALANFFFFAGANCFLLLPLYIRQAGGTDADIGLVMGIYSATAIVCQPLVGLWVDRFGRRPFILFGAGLMACSAVAFSATASIPLLGVLRVLQGIGFSAFFVASYTLIVDLVPVSRRGWALGIFGMFGLLSAALAPLAGEGVIRSFGYLAFFALASLLGLAALALAWSTPEPRRMSLPSGGGLAAIREGMAELVRLPMALAFAFGLWLGTIFTFVPTFAEQLGVANLALFYTGYAGLALVVRVAGGGLIDRVGGRAVIIPALFVQSAGGAVLALLAFARAPGPALPFLFLAGCLAGGAHGFLYPALSTFLMEQTSDARRGKAVGIFSSVILAGNAVGAVAFGLVAHRLGYGVMWSALALLLLTGFGASFRLPRTP